MDDSPDGGIGKIADWAHAAYAQVGEIGAGTRWYDRVYRICRRILRSRIGRKLPWRVREWISLLSGYAHVFHQHEIHKAWSLQDPMRNLTVPEDEHAEIPAIWVVELFPPSEYRALVRAIKRNSWDRRRVRYGLGGPANQAALDQSRTGTGYSWWRLGTVTDLSERTPDVENVRRALPAQFSRVELRALQVGAGLTAVAATFTVRPETSAALDQIWHQTQQPQVHHARGRQPVAESSQFAAYRRTQGARRDLHRAARDWMAVTCPGFFASYGDDAPLLDLVLLQRYDPVTAGSVRDDMADPMRALGLTEYAVMHQASPALPGLLLAQVRQELAPGLVSHRTWTLLGRHCTVIEKLGARLQGTDHDTRGLCYIIGETIPDFLVVLAGSCFIDAVRTRTAASRDHARIAHERFRIRGLKAVRAEVLQTSLDLSTAQRDFTAFYRRRRWEHGHLDFLSDFAPAIRAGLRQQGLIQRAPVKLSERMIDMQLEQLQALIDADQTYREVVSTAAEIGAAVSASRLARVAAVVAVASFVVAICALLVTSVTPHAPLVELWHWLGR